MFFWNFPYKVEDIMVELMVRPKTITRSFFVLPRCQKHRLLKFLHLCVGYSNNFSRESLDFYENLFRGVSSIYLNESKKPV